jgi:nucleoside-diphosphate-sugar epimerase
MLPHVFLTGATGLLGSELMTRLLASGRQVAVLARGSKRSSPRERIETILCEAEEGLGRKLPRPVVLEGDLTSDACGLAEAEIVWLRRSCSRIVHSAASLEFIGSDRAGEPWRSNVGGTKAVLELARRAEIDDFHHVSTAYVCGLSPGPIPEAPSDAAHGFRNDYEASKHEAEWLVRSASFLREPTFYRPAVIVGHSRTGATTTYHGLMAMLQLMTVIVRNLPADETGFRKVSLRLSMTGEEQRNMIPVDWVADVIAHLLDTPGTRGRIFHLAPRQPITIRQIIDFTSSYLNSGGVEFCGPRKPEELNDTESAAYGGKGLYEAYEQTDPPFAMDNLHRFAPHLPCPVIDEAMMHRFLAYGDADRWGKRKRPAPAVATWASELLRGLEADDLFVLARQLAGGRDLAPPAAVGLELVGPGGGSWTIRLGGDATAVLEPGIATDAVRFTRDVAGAESLVRGLTGEPASTEASPASCHAGVATSTAGSTVAAS